MPEALYPLKFQPIYKEKVWGGRTLQRLGRTLPGSDDCKIGESWEVADLGVTSPGGGGGGAERSKVANGALAGQTLQAVMQRFGEGLLGRLAATPTGEFPILIKYLDARENLSVQTHPSPAYLRAHPNCGASLKSEAWYVVAAEKDAVIYKGIRQGVTPQRFRAALEEGDAARVEQMLIKIPVKAGDCHYLPSGTCHALGAGVLVAEVQTPSDTTFRVYDWGRSGRALHLDAALECLYFGPPDTRPYERHSHIAGPFTTISRLVDCEHFRIEKVRMIEGYAQEIPYDQPALWMVLEGAGVITPGQGAEPVPFVAGETLLIPAHSNHARVALHQDTVWLEVTFPQTMGQQIA